MGQVFMRTATPVANQAASDTALAAITPPTGWHIYQAGYETINPSVAGSGQLVIIYRGFPTDEADAASLLSTLLAALAATEVVQSQTYSTKH